MNKLKCITVTTQRAINYGANLQSYALHKQLCKMGVDNELLDFYPKRHMFERPSNLFSRTTLITIAQDIIYLLHVSVMRKMLRNFDDFITNYIKTTRQYGSVLDVIDNYPLADFYLTGSDQVFGVRGKQDQLRMLDFGPYNIYRFSYAGSLAEYDWTEKEKLKFFDRIKRFRLVSVRELYAKKYLEGINSAIKCIVHLDPVFLLSKDEWRNIAISPLSREKYILCYALISNQHTQKLLDLLKEKTGYKIIYVHPLPLKRLKADEYVFTAGPREFLGLLMDAEYVVTTSFHGTAFSIIFEKKFYTLIKNYKSQRITDLLELLNLKDRLYNGESTITTERVDYRQAMNIINQEKIKSTNYLNKIIKIVKNKI